MPDELRRTLHGELMSNLRLIAFALIAALTGSAASANGAYVQSAKGSDNSAQTTASTAAFGVATSTGAVLVYLCTYLHATAEQTAVFTRGSDTAIEVGHFYNATMQHGMRWGYIQTPAAATTAGLCTYGVSVTERGAFVAEYSGQATSSVVGAGEYAGQAQINPGTGTDLVTTGNATPAQQPAVVIGFASTATVYNNLTVGTGFTQRATFNDYAYSAGDSTTLIDKRITSTSAVAPTWTLGTNDYVMSAMIILREPSANIVPQVIHHLQQQSGH